MKRFAIALATFVTCAHCGSEPMEEKPAGEPRYFVAFERDFAGFHSWTNHALKETGEPIAAHLAGPRRVYINKVPPPGSADFPIGTIIVKEVESGEPATRTVLARVKRDRVFNAKGAVGWEWFELVNQPGDTVRIEWRGVDPPVGLCSYGDGSGCNPCHSVQDNDGVLTSALSLR